MNSAILKFDGGARPNPGPAGLGYIIQVDGEIIKGYEHIQDETTNNEAEYKALIGGLKEAHQRGCTALVAKGDAEVIVMQVQGEYNVNKPHLQPLHQQVQELIQEFEEFEIQHIPREENRDVDRLVDQAFAA